MISDLLDYRGNVHFFDEERIPPKEDIMSILNTVHDKLPHVNFKWFYNLNVLGPEESEEKKKIAVSSFCGNGPGSLKKEKWYREVDSLSDSDINHLYKVYDNWKKWVKEEKPELFSNTPQPYDPDIYSFNEQVTAPWVITYRRNCGKGDTHRADIQIGNHSMLTALLALEKGYDVSFCSCFIFRKEFGYKIWKEGDPQIILTLSIGWPDLPRRSQAMNSKLSPSFGKGPAIKPDLESIIL